MGGHDYLRTREPLRVYKNPVRMFIGTPCLCAEQPRWVDCVRRYMPVSGDVS